MTKGHQDISIGNLVGSNIFNTLLVTGSAGVTMPFKVSARFAGGVDYWAMVCISILFWILAVLGRGKIGRITGSVLMIIYVGYITYTSTRIQ
jgi:cation:H+ antiporter